MNGKLNYNRFLENSKRSSVIGYNIYTIARNDMQHSPLDNKWIKPALGLPGIAAIGHEIKTKDILTLEIFHQGKKQNFLVVRNRWTPAWMETYYRNEPEESYYAKSGCLCVKETKCFLEDDTFYSEVELFNDRKESYEVEVFLRTPFALKEDNVYLVDESVEIGCLLKHYKLKGYFVSEIENSSNYRKIVIPANGSVRFCYGFAFEPEDCDKAKERLKTAFAEKEQFLKAEEKFNSWIEKNAPILSTDNIDMLKIYYYRYFVIYHGIHTPSQVILDHQFEGECVYESPFGGWYGGPVGLPIPLQIEDMKWMRTTSALNSQVANWCKKTGVTQGYVQATPMAIWHLYQNHKEIELLEDAYDACKEFVVLNYNLNQPDELPVFTGSWGTGAEYQPSFYQYTDPAWDWRYDSEGNYAWGLDIAKLYRIDDCVMLAGNLKACSEMARVLGREEEHKLYQNCVDRVVNKICEIFWNQEHKFFVDCEPKDKRQCDQALSYDGFMPMCWNLVGRDYDEAFMQLREGGQFHCEFPAPSAGRDCPMYWFDNCLTGPTEASTQDPHEYGCCWNGPSWPYAISHILEALGAASHENKDLEDLWMTLFERYTELHFDCGDRSVPLIVEHYRPTDGVAFSMISDYFHSEWVSLFMNYWAGIYVTDDMITFKPITTDEFVLENVRIHGEDYCFRQWKEEGELKRSFEKM